MATYSDIAANVNITGVVGAINAQFAAVRSMERGTTEPGTIVEGQFWLLDDGTARTLRLRQGGAWVTFANANFTQLNAGGTVAMVADFNAGSQKIINLANGTLNNHAATVGQVTALLNGAATADRPMGGFKITGLGVGTASGHAARVDDAWQDTHAAFWQAAAALNWHDGSATPPGGGFNVCAGGRTLSPGASPSATWTFCPRLLRVRLAGNITPVGGGLQIGTLSGRGVELTINRWLDDTPGGWIDTGQTVLSGGSTCAVEVWWKNDTSGVGRGFAIRLRRTADNALFRPASSWAMGINGAGFN